MKFFARLVVFSAAFVLSVFSYHGFTHKTQSEILSLTENFHEAYKNKNYDFLNEVLTDDANITSSEHNGVDDKSSVFEGLKFYETDQVKIVSIEITPLWIQADRTRPQITFETETVISIDGNLSTICGQYTFVFERRKGNWQIISTNFDINYLQTEPRWLRRKVIAAERILQSVFDKS